VAVGSLVAFAISVACIGMLIVAGRTVWNTRSYGWRLWVAWLLGFIELSLAVVWYAGIAISQTPKLSGLDAIGWAIYLTPGALSAGLLIVLLRIGREP
jgi:hypothetical protein